MGSYYQRVRFNIWGIDMKRMFPLVILLFPLNFCMDACAQTEPETDLIINSGPTFSLAVGYDRNQFSYYVAPSVRKGRHEFLAGVLLTRKNIYKNLSDPSWGPVACYKFYLFNEPQRVNMYLFYGFHYFRQQRDYYYGPYMIPVEGTWNEDYFHNVLGTGYQVFLDKNRRLGFYNSLGYTFAFRREDIQDQEVFVNPLFSYININMGFRCRIATIKGKKVF
jgi:hypothetical protein